MSTTGRKTIKSSSTEDSQLDRFKQTARELGCDETGEAFERAFAKAVPAKSRGPKVEKAPVSADQKPDQQ